MPACAWGQDPPATPVRLGAPDCQPATPVSWSSDKRSPAPEARLGYARDYSWLEGVIERPSNDRWMLRYTDPESGDYWGGKVCLEPDPALAALQDGDRVRVQGELLRDGDRVLVGTWVPYPRYRLRGTSITRQ
jgi:hypothetical protein